MYMYMFVVGNILFFGDFNMEKKIILIGVSLCIQLKDKKIYCKLYQKI